MSWRYALLCLFLFFAVFLLAVKNYELWKNPIVPVPEKREIKKIDAKVEGPPNIGKQPGTSSIKPYTVISEKNIFHPDRKEFSFDQSKPLARPQVVLYGVTISEDYKSASIAYPGRPLKKGEREMMTVKLGEQIGEYKLAKVLPDRITLEAAEDSFDVLLFDSSMPKRRTFTRTEIKPPTATSPTPTSPPPPGSVGTPSPIPPQRVPRPGEPLREGTIEVPVPGSVPPAPVPPPGYYLRGRMPIRPPSTTPSTTPSTKE